MNYNNMGGAPNASYPQQQFTPQYGNSAQPPAGPYPPTAAGAVLGASFPSLAGVGQQQPQQPQQPYPPQYGNQPAYPPQYGNQPQQYPQQYGGQQIGYQQPPYQPGPPPSATGAGYQNYNRPQNTFDERAYLQKIFSEIDSNRDGRITGQELHEALRRGQPVSEFDPYTIQTLIEKYDKDRDNQISFQEFNDLFVQLNAQLNEFYDFDSDNSGSIDGRELGNILRRKGYNFSPDLFNYVVSEISRRSGKNGVNFDTYVRVIARFDFLRAQHSANPQLRSVPLEKYIRDTFF